MDSNQNDRYAFVKQHKQPRTRRHHVNSAVKKFCKDLARPTPALKIHSIRSGGNTEYLENTSENTSKCSEDFEMEKGQEFVDEHQEMLYACHTLESQHNNTEMLQTDLLCNKPDESQLQIKLHEVFLSCGTPHSTINRILNVLRPFHPSLPKDARTLLRTPRTLVVRRLSNGDYCHVGVSQGVYQKLANVRIPSLHSVRIDVNIDGFSLYKSSNIECWPILGRCVDLSDTTPFVIGIFCGQGKPSPLEDYLEDYIKDVIELQKDGVYFDSVKYTFQIRCYLCDAPARSYVKKCKGHTGIHGCERCNQEGTYDNHHMIFSRTCGSLRTDTSFRDKEDPDHHTGDSPLAVLSTPCVSGFPLDPMHLIDQGVMKRIMEFLVLKGPPSSRLRASDIRQLSVTLTQLATHIPSEFTRKLISMRRWSKWKASEFRLLSVYVGPVLFNGLMDPAMFKWFLLLHCAVYILSSKKLITIYLPTAKKLLEVFVAHSDQVFGSTFLSYNVHNLLHICDDAKLYGVLQSFSCYSFESYLGNLKKLVRSPNKPLQQLCRRLVEHTLNKPNEVNSNVREFISEHQFGPTASLQVFKQYQKYKNGNMKFSIFAPDHCVQFVDGQIGLITNFVISDTGEFVVYKMFNQLTDYYDYPLSSTTLGICKCSDLVPHDFVKSISDINCKCVLLPKDDSLICIPFVHQF